MVCDVSLRSPKSFPLDPLLLSKLCSREIQLGHGWHLNLWRTDCHCEVTSVVSDPVRPHRRQPTRLVCPWDSPGKNTGVWVAMSFSREETMLCYAKSLQSCPTLCDPIDGSHQAPPSLGFSREEHWSLGCHFLLQCMKVKSESEVAQSCPTLSDRMDCSLPGSSIHGIFQAKVLEWGAIAFSREETNHF